MPSKVSTFVQWANVALTDGWTLLPTRAPLLHVPVEDWLDLQVGHFPLTDPLMGQVTIRLTPRRWDRFLVTCGTVPEHKILAYNPDSIQWATTGEGE